uniref:Interferon alpha inducible protein 45 n=1 Tax=Cyprinus carpio TaxID=7962 RepID=A0A8C2DIV8_CYPCA
FFLVTLIGAGVGAVAAAPAVLAAAGFTAGGIAAGSVASSLMSAAAVANGGGIAAGSVVATLQAVGADGIPLAGQAIVGTVGALVGAVASMASNSTL